MISNKTAKVIESLSELLTNYLAENDTIKTPVVEYKNVNDLVKLLNLNLQESEIETSELLAEVKKYLKYSVRTSHPQFNNQLTGGFRIEALLAEVVSILGNATMATYEVAPVASLMEEKLISEINKKIGYKNGEGIMLTGGSNANLMAIHCARQRKFPESKMKGNMGKSFCVYVSKEAHYSHKKAMMLMGLGLENLILVNSDEQGRMLASDLQNKIEISISENKTPLLICSTAGTTVFGAFDPIKEIDLVAKEYQIWHHVDGAWGGAVMFSAQYKHLLSGSEYSDSFTFDAHKLMGAGLITSFFLTSHKGVLLEANGGGGSQYIFHEYENSEFDTGRKSLQCGRKVDSLKFWLLWKSLGHKGLESFVNEQYDKQKYFTNKIKENSRFKLIREPEFLNTCFQVIPKDNQEINQFNFDLRFRLVREGKFLTNFSRLDDGTIFFRHIFANNLSTNESSEELLNGILELADRD